MKYWNIKFGIIFILLANSCLGKGKHHLKRAYDKKTGMWPDWWDPADFPNDEEDINIKCDENCKIAFDRCDALLLQRFMDFCQSCCSPAPNNRCEMYKGSEKKCFMGKYQNMMALPYNGGIQGFILQKQYERDELVRNGKWIPQKPKYP